MSSFGQHNVSSVNHYGSTSSPTMMMMHHQTFNQSKTTNNPHIEIAFRDDFRELMPVPTDRTALSREIRYFQAYFQGHRLLQSAKWLGELVVTVSHASNQHISGRSGLEEHLMAGADDAVVFTDAADEIMKQRQKGFNYHYFERPNAASDALNYARTLFDLREYRKCAHSLKAFANEKY